MSIRHTSPPGDPLELFPGSISPTSSSHISYMSNTGAPKINIRKCSPPPEPDTGNAISAFSKPSRSRSGSLKMFRQRLQSLNSMASNNSSSNQYERNNSLSSPSGGHNTHVLSIAPSINSNLSPRSSFDMYSFNGSVDDLTSEPGPEYIRKNIKSYNEVLLSYLQRQGLNINPLRLKQQKLSGKSGVMKFGHSASDSIQTFITGNGQLLYLPHNPTKKKHRVEEGEDTGDNAEQEDDEGDDDDSDDDTSNNHSSQLQERLPFTKRKLHHNVTSHTFGIIIKFSKEQTMNVTAKAKYFADASTRWVSGIYQESFKGKNKVTFKEKYKISKDIHWDLDFGNPDCYIPFKNTEDEDEDEIPFDYGADIDSNDSSKNKAFLDSQICSSQPTQDIKSFEILNVKEYPNEIDPVTGKDLSADESYFTTGKDKNVKTFQPGYYIFILPVVYPLNTPESVSTPLGQMKHHFHIQIERVPYIPSIAPPPSAFLSTSPHHHGKYDDPSYSMDPSSPQSHNNGVGSASKSLFKRLGRRRSSVTKENGSNFLGSLVGGTKSDSITIYDFRYDLPSIRLPPSDATSTLNKSIYVNKVWNEALNYELLLPRKYIQLSPKFQGEPFLKQHSFLLQMKLIPLIKSLCLKRIRINIVEKITYISKDMKYEEDVGRIDRTGVKERTATLLEIKTKEKSKSNSAPALNTQIVRDCVDDNLLTSCYNNGEFSFNSDNGSKKRNRSDSNGLKKVAKFLDSRSASMSHSNSQKESKPSEEIDKEIAITNPVKLQCPLIFYANDPSGFIKDTHEGLARGSADINNIQENDNNDVTSIFSVATHNTYEDTMANNSLNITLSHNDEPIDSVSKSPFLSPSMTPRKGSVSNFSVKQSKEKPDESRLSEFSFYPDTTVHNVKIRHRLQIAFRISKPDEHIRTPDGEPKMHHYEVIVDTPIVFVSPFCVSDTMDLPSYDYAVKSSSIEGPFSSGGSEFKFGRCNDENNDIDEDLPSFDEAVLQPCSPMLSGFTIPTNSGETSNSFTMLSQSPVSSNYSLSPPVSSSLLTTWGKRTSRADSAVSFTNLDSLIQGDVSNLSLSVPSNPPISSMRKQSLEESFAKKDISRVNNMGQLTNLFNPKTFTPLPVNQEPLGNPPQLGLSPRQIPGPTQTSEIHKQLMPVERPGLEHIPSRSSLHFEENLPSYQSVLDQDLAGGLEKLGLLSNNSGAASQERLIDPLSSAGTGVTTGSSRNEETFVNDELDNISLNTINDLNELNVTEANHIL